MNLNVGNSNPAFGRLYVSTYGMGDVAKGMANSLERSISYSPEVDKLDQKGIDIVVIKDKENPHDRAKILFVAPDDTLYKPDAKKDHLKTGKDYDLAHQQSYYHDNSSAVIRFARRILSGEPIKRTRGTTKSIKEMYEEFPVRTNSKELQNYMA